jgi:hypothetical protein
MFFISYIFIIYLFDVIKLDIQKQPRRPPHGEERKWSPLLLCKELAPSPTRGICLTQPRRNPSTSPRRQLAPTIPPPCHCNTKTP